MLLKGKMFARLDLKDRDLFWVELKCDPLESECGQAHIHYDTVVLMSVCLFSSESIHGLKLLAPIQVRCDALR